MTDSQKLLAEYARTGSDIAFRQLVTRYVDLVYSTALRLVNGDTHRAEDVAQTVFVDLARLARTLSDDVMPGGWLHRHTCFVAVNTMRGERRRQSRERQAVEMNALQDNSGADFSLVAPILDEAINELGEADRAAILLRFFEQRDFRAVGQALGGSEDAARMRVNRALEKLESLLKRRNIPASSAALAVVLGANAVQAAPAGLAVTISAAALAGTTIAATTIATHATMSWINLKFITALAAAALAAGLGTHLVQQREANRLRSENQNLVAQQEQMTAQRDAAPSPTANQDELERLRKDQDDLLRLRGEVGTLRAQLKELDQLRAENQQLKSSLSQTAEAAAQKKADLEADPAKQAAIAKMNDAKLLVLGLLMYAGDNQGQLPADFNQTSNYLAKANLSLTDLNQFELVLQGSLSNVTNPSEIIAVREKQAWFSNGNWLKAYGFADGHCEVHAEAGGNFEAWEKQRLFGQPNQ